MQKYGILVTKPSSFIQNLERVRKLHLIISGILVTIDFSGILNIFSPLSSEIWKYRSCCFSIVLISSVNILVMRRSLYVCLKISLFFAVYKVCLLLLLWFMQGHLVAFFIVIRWCFIRWCLIYLFCCAKVWVLLNFLKIIWGNNDSNVPSLGVITFIPSICILFVYFSIFSANVTLFVFVDVKKCQANKFKSV